MNDQNTRNGWRAVPGAIADRTRDLLRAGLGLVDVLEEQGERALDTLRGDRAELVENLQERGSRAIDDMQAEANRVFSDLVDRGEKLQQKGEKRVEKTMRNLADRPREMAGAIERSVERVVGATLKRLDVPTRSEVERLGRRVERLTNEVERLASRLTGERPPVVFEVASVQDRWIVRDAGTGDVLHDAETKADAVRQARESAHAAAPSELRILKQDGTVQDTAHYA